jgi:hypothetical protein
MSGLSEETKKRCDELHALGLKFNGEYYQDGRFMIHWTDIACDDENQWNKTIEDIKNFKNPQ